MEVTIMMRNKICLIRDSYFPQRRCWWEEKFVLMVGSRVFYLDLNWSVATAYAFMFTVDLPVKFTIFHYESSTS